MSPESGATSGDAAGGVTDIPQSTRQELVAILDQVPAMVAYWGNDLRNVFANEAYAEWFGRSPGDIRGVHARDLLGPELFALNLPYVQGVLAGRPQTFERAVVDMAGRPRHLQTSYAPHLVDGVVQGFFALGTDITARVEAEVVLGESIKKMAASGERDRIETALHSTVLQRLFVAGLELEAAKQPGAVDTAERIQSAIGGIDAAITELRSAVRVDSGPVEFTVAIDQVVRRVAATLGFAAERTYTGALDSVPTAVWAELLTVLIEALSDAARYADASRVDIAVTAHAGEVELRVRDDGPAPDQGTRSAALANMRASAERLGGTLTWEPNKPSGTIIHWRVPITGMRAGDPAND